jgi:ATP-dependent Clp protease ATP-binding subunit ClpA
MPGQRIPPSSPEEALAGKQLTPRMLRVLAAAADEAKRRGHSFVGTEHALLGLLSEPDGIAAVILRRLGTADAAATETRKIMDSEGYNRPQSKPGP